MKEYTPANRISKVSHKVDNRNSSIELLRIISMMGIVILHYNNENIGGAFKYAAEGSPSLYYLYFTTSIFACTVDLFMIISAYYLSSTNQRNLIKVVELLLQVIAFRCGFYLIRIIAGNTPFTLRDFLRSLLPINYFAILWSAIYILSPYFNILIDRLDRKQFKKLIIILVLLFSVWTIFVDFLESRVYSSLDGLSTVGMYGSQYGYTIVNFSLLYFIGAYIQKNNIRLSSKKTAFGIIITLAVIYISSIIEGYSHTTAWYYNNPLIILLAALILLSFLNVRFHNKAINELAKSAFTCFLCQVKIIENYDLENIVNHSVFILGIHQFGLVVAIYILSYVVFKIYYLCSHWFIKLLIPLCNKINISI